jgi:MFS transporter, PPP family, 3-phenylpropionic acid transporter
MANLGTLNLRLGFTARLALLYAAMLFYFGVQLPYFPVWLDWRGLSAQDIAIISSAPLMCRLIATPLVSFLADLWGTRRTILLVLAWAGLAVGICTASASSFWPILLLQILFASTWTSMMPLTEAVAMAGVKAAGLSYGQMRLWGSAGFLVANLIGGWLIAIHGPGAATLLMILGLIVTVVAAHLLPVPEADDATPAGKATVTLSDSLALITSPTMVWFLLAAGAAQASHAVLYVFGTLHWRAQGLASGWAGALWAISIIAEIALFAAPVHWIQRVSSQTLMLIGVAGGLVRWIVMGFDPPLPLLVLLQVLHAASFTATHLAAMHLINRIVPDAQTGVAQALYATLSGSLATAAAMQAAGLLFPLYGGRAYWAMAALSVLAMCALWMLSRALRQATPPT